MSKASATSYNYSAKDTVTVCSSCLCASCWQGMFYCDYYRTAGTVEKTVAELRELNREHPSYYESSIATKVDS